jgi:hypothetical protein
MKRSFSVGSTSTPLLGNKNEGWCTKSLVKPQGQRSMVTKTEGVHLIGVTDTPVACSRNKWTRDEHGNARGQ